MKVTDECKQAFVDVQLGHKYQYVVYKLNDKMTEIVVEKKGEVGKIVLICLIYFILFKNL